jgi:hypothetical protein
MNLVKVMKKGRDKEGELVRTVRAYLCRSSNDRFESKQLQERKQRDRVEEQEIGNHHLLSLPTKIFGYI